MARFQPDEGPLTEDRKVGGWGLAAMVFLSALFALNVSRALTQSITTDEAFSYLHYIGTDRFVLLRDYSANVHFLHTLLVWVSVHVFGLSEGSMRLPSLVGCALYFTAIWKICRLPFGNRPASLAAVAVLAANPLIEDHMSVSRGYGLALAFFAWALYEGLRILQFNADKTRGLFRIAILCALSAACNLTFVVPTAAFMMVLAWMLWRNATSARLFVFMRTLWTQMLGPWLIMLFVLLVIPLSRVGPGTFYFGADSAAESVRTLIEMSGGRSIATLSAAIWIGSGLFAGLLSLFVLLLMRSETGTSDAFGLLTVGTFLLTTIGLGVGHLLIGLAYPSSRTGLHLIFLALLSLLWISRWKSGLAALTVLSSIMLFHIRPDRYQEWVWDSDNRAIVQAIVARHKDQGSAQVFTSPFLDQSLTFYARMYRLSWLSASDVLTGTADYAALWEVHSAEIEKQGLHEVFVGPSSGVILAVRK